MEQEQTKTMKRHLYTEGLVLMTHIIFLIMAISGFIFLYEDSVCLEGIFHTFHMASLPPHSPYTLDHSNLKFYLIILCLIDIVCS